METDTITCGFAFWTELEEAELIPGREKNGVAVAAHQPAGASSQHGRLPRVAAERARAPQRIPEQGY